jgi:phosphatidylglycerophosphate synthase
MRIYNYLFYKTYLLMQRSKNFDDMPALGGMVFVTGCLMLNIFTVFLLLEGLGINTGIEFKKEYKYVFTLSLVALLLFYYSYKGRYKKIVESYEQKKKGKQLHPVIVIIIYLASSFLLGMLAAMYKNHDWIFG